MVTYNDINLKRSYFNGKYYTKSINHINVVENEYGNRPIDVCDYYDMVGMRVSRVRNAYQKSPISPNFSSPNHPPRDGVYDNDGCPVGEECEKSHRLYVDLRYGHIMTYDDVHKFFGENSTDYHKILKFILNFGEASTDVRVPTAIAFSPTLADNNESLIDSIEITEPDTIKYNGKTEYIVDGAIGIISIKLNKTLFNKVIINKITNYIKKYPSANCKIDVDSFDYTVNIDFYSSKTYDHPIITVNSAHIDTTNNSISFDYDKWYIQLAYMYIMPYMPNITLNNIPLDSRDYYFEIATKQDQPDVLHILGIGKDIALSIVNNNKSIVKLEDIKFDKVQISHGGMTSENLAKIVTNDAEDKSTLTMPCNLGMITKHVLTKLNGCDCKLYGLHWHDCAPYGEENDSGINRYKFKFIKYLGKLPPGLKNDEPATDKWCPGLLAKCQYWDTLNNVYQEWNMPIKAPSIKLDNTLFTKDTYCIIPRMPYDYLVDMKPDVNEEHIKSTKLKKEKIIK